MTYLGHVEIFLFFFREVGSPPTTTHSETLTVAAFRPPLRYLTSTCYEAIVSFALVTLLPNHGVVQFDGVLLGARAWVEGSLQRRAEGFL